jgi:hypothetical protein
MNRAANTEEQKRKGFWEAWAAKDKARLRDLIDRREFSLNQDIEDPERPGIEQPPLFFAIQRGDIEFVEFFLEMGADVNYISHGLNCLFSVKDYESVDNDILAILLNAGVLLLPHYPTGKTLEEFLLEEIKDYSEKINYIATELPTTNANIRQMRDFALRMRTAGSHVEMLRPFIQFYQRTLRIESQSGPLGELKMDVRATVDTLKNYILNFFIPEAEKSDFSLLMPSFRHPNVSKQRMENDRVLTDYNPQDNIRIIVIPRMRTELNGGRRKTRKRRVRRT